MAFEDMLSAPAAPAHPGPMQTEWRHPSREFTICMEPLPAFAIPEKSLASLKKSEPREIGGILFGTMQSAGNEHKLVITSAEFIPSATNLFLSTANDADALTTALTHVRHDGAVPVGYFRSHIRDGLCLSPQDKSFFEQHFRNPQHICMLIRPFEMGVCMAGFFLWENGRLQSDFTDFEVPLFGSGLEERPAPAKAAAAVAAGRPIQVPARVEAPAPKPPPPVAPPAPTPSAAPVLVHEPARQPSTSIQNAAILLLSAALVAGLLVLWSALRAKAPNVPEARQETVIARTPGPASTSEIGLQITRPAADQFDLTWNRNLPATVEKGEINIEDGSTRRKIALDPAQLHSGKLTYFAKTGDVDFQLEVSLAGGRSMSESLRVLASGRATPLASVPLHTDIPNAGIENRGKVFETPAPRPVQADARTYVKAEAPLVEGSSAGLQDNGAIGALVGPSPRENFEALVKAPAAPASDYVAPVPLKQPLPDIRTMMPAGVSAPTRVEVLVNVDKNGNVLTANTMQKSILRFPCISAALHWHFTPATLHGRPVESRYLIQFNFQPGR